MISGSFFPVHLSPVLSGETKTKQQTKNNIAGVIQFPAHRKCNYVHSLRVLVVSSKKMVLEIC